MNNKANANKIIASVKTALESYPSSRVCVSVDEEEDQVIVAYHSPNNGFPIEETGISPDDVDTDVLHSGLDKLDVGYDF